MEVHVHLSHDDDDDKIQAYLYDITRARTLANMTCLVGRGMLTIGIENTQVAQEIIRRNVNSLLSTTVDRISLAAMALVAHEDAKLFVGTSSPFQWETPAEKETKMNAVRNTEEKYKELTTRAHQEANDIASRVAETTSSASSYERRGGISVDLNKNSAFRQLAGGVLGRQ